MSCLIPSCHVPFRFVPFPSFLFNCCSFVALHECAERYREWSLAKVKEARRAKKQAAAAREEKADWERRRKAEGLRAYRKWVRLASKQQ